MAREDVVESFLSEHAERFLQPEEEMYRHRAIPIPLRIFAEEPPPVPIDAWQLGCGGRGERLGADPGERHAGRQHEALLRAGDDDIDAPFIHAEIKRAERRDRIDEKE